MGYPVEEALGKNYLDFIQADYRKDAERFYGIQLVKRIPNTYYEFPAQTKDGKILWLGQNVRLIVEENSVIGFQAVARDITERIRAEEDLKQSEERYRSLVENTLDCYFICEIPSGRFLFLNQRICDLFGYTMEEGLGLSL